MTATEHLPPTLPAGTAAWLAELEELRARGECTDVEYWAAIDWLRRACGRLPVVEGGDDAGVSAEL